MEAALAVPDVIPVEAITRREDRFVCAPYGGCTFRAGACGDRQADARIEGKATQFGKCVSCALGQRVEARLREHGVGTAAAKGGRCTRPGCTWRSVSARGLCARHRMSTRSFEIGADAVAARAPAKPKPRAKTYASPVRTAPVIPVQKAAPALAPEKVEAAMGRNDVAKELEEDCSREGCVRKAREGYAGLCNRHHAAVTKAKTTGTSAAAPSAKKRGPYKKKDAAPGPAAGSGRTLAEAVEAVAILDAIGWDVGRALRAVADARER